MLQKYQEILIKEIEDFLPKGPLFDLIRYHIQGGKMVRPILCLSACRALGGKEEGALPVACSIELLHNFTLIHDDIEDGSETRSGRPALWKIFGQAQAINAADALFALSHLLLLKAAERGVEFEKVYLLDKLFNETCLKICFGQAQDLSLEKQHHVKKEEYFSMASKKTGALFEYPLLAGAIIAGHEEKASDSLRRCGELLGIGFQIQDDILSFQDDERAFFELKRRKKTFPLIYAMEKKPQISEIYCKENLGLEDISYLLTLIRGSDVMGYSLKIARDFYKRAMSALREACLPKPDEIEWLILFLEGRVG